MPSSRLASACVIAAVVLVSGCGEVSSEETTASTSEAGSATGTVTLWRELGGWIDRGDRQTESFDVTSGALRLGWAARSGVTADQREGGPGRLRVTLHSAISGRPLETVVDVTGPGSDTVRFAASPRVAYLLIQSDGLDWELALEEGVTAPASAERDLR